MFNEYKRLLKVQKESHLLRKPEIICNRQGKYVDAGKKRLINFASNDYLGLCSDKKIKQIFSKNFQKYPCSSSSSRVVCGNYSVVLEAEKNFADFFGYEDCLFFQSGFQANLALMSTIFLKNQSVLADKHIHASSIMGLKLGGVPFKTYNHNKISHLRKRLDKLNGKSCWVITESLFSMDGDVLDVDNFFKLKEEFGFFSVVDEAHSVGAMGKEGRGITTGRADIVVGTFTKAFGFFGAFILLPSVLKEYMFNFAAPLIYSTALPPAHAACAIEILDVVKDFEDRRWYLQELSLFARENLKTAGIPFVGESYLLSINIGNESLAQEVARELFSRNYMVFCSRHPTVPLGKSILRLSLCYFHTDKDIDKFVKNLQDVLFKYGILK
ncbi:8-amino-7-oxononanoate synthase [Desulfothermus naphthae]